MTAKSRPNTKPTLICGPTASGKSALGLLLAQKTGATIINADALQVYDCWRVLSARPSIEEESLAEHRLYGHVNMEKTYSVGGWLRDVTAELSNNSKPTIILGGTGLYFTALTNGLAVIPETPQSIRERGDKIRKRSNTIEFIEYLVKFDPETLTKTDQDNAMRLQRAWEVLETTGRGLSSWQEDTPEPLLSLHDVVPIVLNSNTEWLNNRIAKRFDVMLDSGALDEAKAVEPNWNPSLPSSRALGARELIAYLRDEMSLDEARLSATIATRQFAKRQRTWFRSKMKDWHQVQLDDETDLVSLADRIIQNGNPT